MAPYADAVVAVRDDLVAAHEATVAELARPGTWWTGEERRAIAAEVRRARAWQRSADAAPPWATPSSMGLLEQAGPLPAVAVDAIWRIANHPGTLAEDWYGDVVASGLSPERYVELAGIVATLTCVDTFAWAMSAAPLPLPEAQPGEPTREVPADVDVKAHWVPTVTRRGPNVTKALSLVPAAEAAMDRLSEAQYVPRGVMAKDFAWTRGALDRMQVELLAARTSALNECFY